ncbi:FMN-dependent NADH-azoreductase [Oxalobacteraceae bacterium OM1]|nr:FMN-dependent NADH-azoreductase [Oxalobacteraceae bacterium OM1]
MKALLHIAASPRIEASHSRHAAQTAIHYWRSLDPKLVVIHRDLAIDPVPHPDACFVQATLNASSGHLDEMQRKSLAMSDTMIGELDAADMVLISTPMHNFFVPSNLKAWLDYVVRPGRTFRSKPQGKVGLLRDRPVRVLMACGGSLGKGAGQKEDWATPYLRHMFKTIGILDVEVFALENCNRGPQAAALTMQKFENWLVRQPM